MVVEHHRPGTLLPVRSDGRFQLASEPMDATRRSYGSSWARRCFEMPCGMHSFGRAMRVLMVSAFWSLLSLRN